MNFHCGHRGRCSLHLNFVVVLMGFVLFSRRPSQTRRRRPPAQLNLTRCKVKSTKSKSFWKTTSTKCWRGETGWMIWLARPTTYRPLWVSLYDSTGWAPYPVVYKLFITAIIEIFYSDTLATLCFFLIVLKERNCTLNLSDRCYKSFLCRFLKILDRITWFTYKRQVLGLFLL